MLMRPLVDAKCQADLKLIAAKALCPLRLLLCETSLQRTLHQQLQGLQAGWNLQQVCTSVCEGLCNPSKHESVCNIWTGS